MKLARGITLAGAAVLVASTPQVALAQGIDGVTDLDLVVSGSIAEQCALGSVGDMDFGNLERRGLGSETGVAFYCNVPFTMTINGANGALTHNQMPNGQGPYAGAVEYSMGISMPLRNPTRRVMQQTFNSRALQGGGVLNSNGAIATEGMQLTIELAPVVGKAGLLAGDYSETISITVSPL
ncbi:MAG: hypothetical protein AAFR88_11440 [Pseudomonadota bacterium]